LITKACCLLIRRLPGRIASASVFLIPSDPKIPLQRNKIHPLHEVVKIDCFLPGCPPPAEMFWSFFDQLPNKQPIEFTYRQIHYD